MGNNLQTEFRGDVDVALTDIINALSTEEYKAFLDKAENVGALDPADYPNKEDLINGLPQIDQAIKD